jgi:hypothetical protein
MKELKVFVSSLAMTSLALVTLGLMVRLFWEALKLGWSFVDLVL